MKRSLMTGVLSVFGGKAAMFVVTLATTPILVRYLGSGRYGDYAFLMSVFAMLMILVSSGVGDGVRKFVVEDRSLPNWEAHVVGYYVRHATLLAVAGSGGVALLAASGLVGRFVDEALEPYFYLLSAMVIAAQFRELVRRTLMGFGKEHYAEVLRVAKNVCFAGFGIGLVVLGHGVTGVLVGHLASSLLAALAGIVLVHRHVSLSYVFERAPVSFPKRELLTFNGYTIVFIMLMTSLYHVDLLMLRPMAGSDQTGYYKGALALAEFLWFAPVALQTVFVHSTSELWSKGRTGKISELASRTTRFTFLLTALLAIGIAALADVFVPLYYGEAFTPAVEPLLLLLPGALGFAVARPIFAIGQGKGDMRVLVAATGGAAGINLVLNALLIPRYGMAGAAVATSVGYASMLVVHVAAARVVGFDPIRDIRPVRTGLTVVASGAAILLVARSIRDPLVALVAVPPIGLVLFGSLAFATGAVDAHEIRSLVDSLPLPSIPMPTIQAASPSTEQLESVMMILGIVLLVAAVALAAPVSSFIGAVDDRDDPSSGDNVTGDGVTPANSSVVTASPTATPTATPNETATPTSTPNETATPTETDDDGGFWGPILSDDTPTPTESDDDGDGDEGDDEDDGWSDPDTSTPEPDPTATPEPNATATPAPEPTDTPTDTPTDEPPATSTAEPTPTDTPVDEPTASPTATPTATPTDEPTPTATPTDEPTATPTAEPTTPTAEPTDTPTDGTTPTENTQQTATATSSESGSTAETQSSDGGAYFFVPPAWIADLVPGTPNVR